MATKSIGSSVSPARDFLTIAAWASYANALTLSAAEVGECYNDSQFTSVALITLGGWSGGSGTNTVTLKCHAGESFRDNASVLSNALRYNQSNGVGLSAAVAYDQVITVSGQFFIMDGLQIKTTLTSANNVIFCDVRANVTIQNCIIQGTARNSNGALLDCNNGDSTCLFQNNLFLSTGADGCGVIASNGGTFYDNTIVAVNSSAATGLKNAYGPGPIVKNCAVAGFTTDYAGTADAASTSNATDKSSFGGTNYGGSGQVSLVGATEWQSVTLGSEDLRTKSTSAKLKSNGATVGPSTDIAAQTRTAPYTIGAWQFVQAGTTITPSVGSLALTGQAPIVTRTLNSVITPTVGALAISGLAPTVTATINRFAQPSAGTLTLTGQAPIVTATNSTTQLGISVGSPQSVGGIECYTSVTHVRAGMGTGGIEAILYTAP